MLSPSDHNKQEAQSDQTDTLNFPPSLRAYHVVTLADRGPVPTPVTEMKSEAPVGADQRSAPHSSPGVLMASDNTRGDRQALGVKHVFTEGEMKFSLLTFFYVTQFKRLKMLKGKSSVYCPEAARQCLSY